jgi:hypothetical protein
MAYYRLYFMSLDGAHIERFEPIDGACDTEAVDLAGAYSGYGQLELYHRGRKVHQFSSFAPSCAYP